MEKVWAVVEENGLVSNIIIADDEFIDGIKESVGDETVNTGPFHDKHTFVDITDLDERPGNGWRMDGDTFIAPPVLEEPAAE